MFEPLALIFDCDGTIAHTMPLHWRAWNETVQRHGIFFSEDRFYALGGVPARHILKTLFAEQDRSDLDPLTVAKEKEGVYLQLLHEVTPVQPVLDLARRYRGILPMAIATGGSRPSIPTVLKHLGILDWFDAVVTSEDVILQKPSPDIFLEAARRLGVAADRCRAFEDTDLGMQAIYAAGMDAVDVRLLPDYPGRR